MGSKNIRLSAANRRSEAGVAKHLAWGNNAIALISGGRRMLGYADLRFAAFSLTFFIPAYLCLLSFNPTA